MNTAIHAPRERTDRPPGRWTPLLLGLAGVAAAPVIGLVLRGVRAVTGPVGSVPALSPGMFGVLAALGLSLAGVAVGVRALRRGVRGGVIWTGTLVSGAVLLLWAAFAVAEVVFPH